MAQKTDVELQAQRAEIESETGNKANTAARVGQMLEDIIDSKINNDDAPEGGGLTSVNGDTGPVVTIVAGDIPNTPAGGVASTTVQAAINELDSEKQTAAQVQSAITSAVAGLFDDRGNFDASVNAYPSSGGSGTAGAILKGDIWRISVAGTLPTSLAVNVGDSVRALTDTPGNTQANWAIGEGNIVDASETAKGIVERATDAETLAGTDTDRFISPASLKAMFVPVVHSTATLTISDAHHNKLIIFTVACTVTIPSGLRTDLKFDVYAISTVTAVVFTTGITYEASPVGATVIRGGMAGSFRMRASDSIIAIFGENLQEYLVTPSTDAVTTVATVTDINGCSVTLQESSVYAIKGQLVIGCDNTGGVKFGFVSPSGAFYRITIFGLTTAATAYTRVILVADGLTSVGFCTVNSAGAGGFITVEGTIELGAGEGGTFKMQFASTTGGQTSTVYRFGSYLRFTKIV